MIPHAFLKINDFQRQLRLARRYNNMMLLGVTNSRNSQISCVLQSSSKMVHFTQVVCFGQSTSFHYKSASCSYYWCPLVLYLEWNSTVGRSSTSKKRPFFSTCWLSQQFPAASQELVLDPQGVAWLGVTWELLQQTLEDCCVRGTADHWDHFRTIGTMGTMGMVGWTWVPFDVRCRLYGDMIHGGLRFYVPKNI